MLSNMTEQQITSDAVLAKLVDEQLSAVTFVQDYVQLNFDGLRLTMNVWPICKTVRDETRFGEMRYRDELCSFIGEKVIRATEVESAIEIFFNIGSIRVDLLTESAVERVVFEDTGTRAWAWW